MKKNQYLFYLLIVITLVSCSKFRKIQKSGDWQEKYEAAVAYYEAQDYHRATMLFEDILPIIKGTEQAELGSFYLAYCYYHQKQYILSAHNFLEFITIYGRSEYVIEGTYLHAHSLFLQSPDYQLDQTATLEAAVALQNFINKYPETDYAQQADQLIDELQVKLERKAYENCKLYHKLKSYKAALVVYDNFNDDFPDSKFNEEIGYFKIETSHDYAMESIRSKQEERFNTTVDYYLEFLDNYPNSKLIRDAEKLYANSIEQLRKFADSKG